MNDETKHPKTRRSYNGVIRPEESRKRPQPEQAAAPVVRNGKLIDDSQNGDAVTEAQWIERRKEQTGWRNGARVRKL